jgi:hypothetical protein
MWVIGFIVFTLVILVANLKLAFEQLSWSWFNHAGYLISVLAWVTIAWAVSEMFLLAGFGWYHMLPIVASTGTLWLIIPLVSLIAIGGTVLWKGKKMIFPDYQHLAREVYKYKLDEKLLETKSSSGDHIPMPAHVPSQDDKSITNAEMNSSSTHGKGSSFGSKATQVVTPTSVVNAKVASAKLNSARRMSNGFAFSSDAQTAAVERLIVEPTSKRPGTLRDQISLKLAESKHATMPRRRSAGLMNDNGNASSPDILEGRNGLPEPCNRHQSFAGPFHDKS